MSYGQSMWSSGVLIFLLPWTPRLQEEAEIRSIFVGCGVGSEAPESLLNLFMLLCSAITLSAIIQVWGWKVWVVRLKAIEKNLTKGCRVGLFFFFSLLSVGHERRKKKASPLRFGREYASMGGAWWGEGCILYVQEKLIPALEEQNKHLRIKNRWLVETLCKNNLLIKSRSLKCKCPENLQVWKINFLSLWSLKNVHESYE